MRLLTDTHASTHTCTEGHMHTMPIKSACAPGHTHTWLRRTWGGGEVKTNLKAKAVIKEKERVPDLYSRKNITGQNTMNAHSNKNRRTVS